MIQQVARRTNRLCSKKRESSVLSILWVQLAVFLLLCGTVVVLGQQDDYGGGDYDDYGADYGAEYGDAADGPFDDYQQEPPVEHQDSLYHDYAERQHEKEVRGMDARGGAGGGMGGIVAGSVIGWIVGGKFHSARTARNMKLKFQKEQKQLYSQYYNDVYKLTDRNSELQLMVEQLQDTLRQTEARHELEALQRDYDEFKQPDLDGDDRISRAEFDMYVKNYLSNFPGLEPKDYPKFEDFDHDHDGYVSFQEYAQQMAVQAQQLERDQLYGTNSNSNSAKSKGINELYAEASKADSFQDLYSQLRNL